LSSVIAKQLTLLTMKSFESSVSRSVKLDVGHERTLRYAERKKARSKSSWLWRRYNDTNIGVYKVGSSVQKGLD
jgi:hypothetical protein